jgi:hypothetical protein
MIDQDGKGGRHSLAKLLQANKTWKKKMKGKIDKRFWGISIYIFFYSLLLISFLSVKLMK